jgi:hypothetical protein
MVGLRSTVASLTSEQVRIVHSCEKECEWRIRRLASDAHSPRRNHESQAGVSRQAVRMRRKCTKAGCGNNSTGHETLERRLVQLLVIARDIQSVLHSTTSELYRTTYRNSTASRRTYASVSGRETWFEL